MWSGRHLRADEAATIGLVDRVVPDAEVELIALTWAHSLAEGAVVAMGLAKRAINGGLDGSLADGLDLERDAFVEVFRTEDATTGIRSFLEHGPGARPFTVVSAPRQARRGASGRAIRRAAARRRVPGRPVR